ncbi:MAG: hypothetical protein O3A25_19620 [Acidobacteria bacterium]|nr:hypothetical protein [Acidobacteriota bacterium]
MKHNGDHIDIKLERYHQTRGPWNRECTCGRKFLTMRGAVLHGHSQRRARRKMKEDAQKALDRAYTLA